MNAFLLKNVSTGQGLYRVNGQDFILNPGDQVTLDYPPEFRSAELKLFTIKK